REDEEEQRAGEERREQEDQEEAWEREEDVRAPHEQRVDPTARAAGRGADRRAEEDGERDRRARDEERRAGAREAAGEEIATELIGSEEESHALDLPLDARRRDLERARSAAEDESAFALLDPARPDVRLPDSGHAVRDRARREDAERHRVRLRVRIARREKRKDRGREDREHQ